MTKTTLIAALQGASNQNNPVFAQLGANQTQITNVQFIPSGVAQSRPVVNLWYVGTGARFYVADLIEDLEEIADNCAVVVTVDNVQHPVVSASEVGASFILQL